MPPNETVEETFRRGAESLGQDPTAQIESSVAAGTQAQVPVASLESPVPPTEIPPLEVDPNIASSAGAAGVLAAQTAEANATAQAAEAETAEQRGSVEELMDFVGGRSADRATAIEGSVAGSAGQKELADFSSNIRLQSAQLAEFDDDTFLGEEALRGDASSRDLTKATFGAKSRERRLQRAIDRTGKAASLRVDIATAELMQNNITAATAQIDAAMEAKYGPQEKALENEMFFLQRQWQVADKADQRLFEAKQNEVTQQLNDISDAKDMVNNAVQYATPAELQAMNDPSLSATEQYEKAQAVVSRGMREDRRFEIQKRNLDLAVSNQELSNLIAEGNYDPVATTETAVNQMVDMKDAPSIRNYISTVMGRDDIPSTVRSEIGASVDVITQIESFVDNNPEGNFSGLGAGSGFSSFGLGAKVGSEARRQEVADNRAFTESVNLKVQQWASGASLTEEQTKSVKKFIPLSSDSDKQIRVKTNSLYNEMNKINQAKLLRAGINVVIPRIDLFESARMMQDGGDSVEIDGRISEEQRLELSDYMSEFGTNSSTAPII